MRRLKGLFAVACVLGLAAPTSAQQSNVSSSRLMFDPAGLQGSDSRKMAPAPQTTSTTGQNVAPHPPAAPPARQTVTPPPPAAPAARQAAVPKPPAPPAIGPAAAPKQPARATANAPARPAAARRPAQADTADNRNATSSTSARAIPREQPAPLGRVALPQGSLGFENQTQIKAYNMSDGRRVPGYDNIQRNDSSYFGLSLRLPTAATSSSSSSSPPSLFRDHGAN